MLPFLNKNLIGVDIGSYSIKIVNLKGKEGAYTLDAAACFKLPQSETRGPALAGLLSEFVRFQKIRARRAASVMTGHSLMFRHIVLPVMPAKDLKEAVKWEIRKEVSIAPGELVADYVLAGTGGKTAANTQSIIAFAAVKKEINELISLFKAASLELRAIDVVPTALLAAFDVNNAWEEGINYAVLDIGYTKSALSIFKDRKLGFTRELSFGGLGLTRAIAKAVNKTEQEAEEYKISRGLSGHVGEGLEGGEGDGALIKNSITASLEGLCSEIHRSFDYYQAQFREGSVSRLILTGGTARLPGIEGFISNFTGIPCAADDPLKNIKVPAVLDTPQLRSIAHCLTVAVGLATGRA